MSVSLLRLVTVSLCCSQGIFGARTKGPVVLLERKYSGFFWSINRVADGSGGKQKDLA